jgi:site-specific DNA recombinase
MADLACIYCRVSSENQRDNYSIGQQKSACLELAKKEGYKVKHIFVDEAETATADDRPQFQEMISMCEQGDIKNIIVYHTDRWARNELDHALYKSHLKKLGVKLLSVTQPMIDESPEGYLLDGMMANINAYYSRDLGRKTIRGMNGRWKTGYLPSMAPPGYVNLNKEGMLVKIAYNAHDQQYFDEIKKKRVLKPIEIHPLFGPLVKEAFQKYATGDYSIKKLAEFLGEKGLKNRKGGVISHSVLHNMLNNTFYYGMMHWSGEKKMGKHEPLVTQELFESCQVVLARHRQFLTRDRVHNFLLNGFVFCPHHKCKRKASKAQRDQGTYYVEDYRRYTAEWHKIKRSKNKNIIGYYHCTEPGCPKSYVEKEHLEGLVLKQIKKLQFSDKVIENIRLLAKDVFETSKEDLRSKLQGLTNKKAALEDRQSKLIELIIDGDMPREALKRKQAELEDKITEVGDQIDDLKRQTEIDYKLIEEVLYLTRNIYDTYLQSPEYLQRHYLRLFFERIFVSEGKITEIVETPIFSEMKKQQRLIIKYDMLPG